MKLGMSQDRPLLTPALAYILLCGLGLLARVLVLPELSGCPVQKRMGRVHDCPHYAEEAPMHHQRHSSQTHRRQL